MFSGIVKEAGLSTYAVFESMRAYQGRIFEFDAHLKRLYESAQTIILKIPQDKQEMKMHILHTLKRDGLKNAYIRISARGDSGQRARIGIVTSKVKLYPADFYQKGIGVVSAAVKRDFINTLAPNIKSANFLSGVLAKIEANRYPKGHRQNAFEALLLNPKGYVTEGTVSNLFMVKGEKLLTPLLSCGALGGITRQVVIDLAENLSGIEVKEALITRHDIYNAEEVFLTNTSIEIMPVVSCDGRIIADGQPGKITRKLMTKFKATVRGRTSHH